MVRSQAALKLRQSQFRKKYIQTSYIKLYAKLKYCNFKERIEQYTERFNIILRIVASLVSTRCARPVRSAQGTARTEDVTY